MSESLEEFFTKKGSIGLLVVLSDGNVRRFSDLEDELLISTQTLTRRLGEARRLGLIAPEIEEEETAVKSPYRISGRGMDVVRQMDENGVLHAYKAYLERRKDVEDGRDALVDWVTQNKRMLAEQSEKHPHVDRFGNDITGHRNE